MIEKDLDNDLAILAFIQNPIAMLILDENAIIIKTNLAFNELTGYQEIDLLGKHISFFESNRNETSLYDAHCKNTIHSEDNNGLVMYVLCKNDAHLLICNNRQSIIKHGKKYTIFTFKDITEQKRILEHYQYLATHDTLTGLANRVLLDDEFKKAQSRAARSHQKMALLLCDINEFKHCNDKYGHDFGDTVLKVVAQTLDNLLRVNDTVARYGGDEFVLILEDMAQSNQIAQIETTIKSSFPITVIKDEQICQVNISIGSACFPDDGTEFNQLIQVADQNMYREKKRFYGYRKDSTLEKET